ncbi:hypothetical protein BV25DRAFT_190053 [Artomyces pyxidatus]|uniref:Uncharacterized protein n=1 Tax=Artomyces pyxidatus TaxID=48021 RepID=A0ACB8T8G1_9AGAM|nr:hypothetical protein BV25DRAFT_190053 [Artomyces pyxidatus]
MFVVTSTMYTIASLRIVLHLNIEKDAAVFDYQTIIRQLVDQYSPTLNFILGDAIVAWRAWVIWDRSYRVLIVPIMLLVGTTGVVAAELVLGVRFALATKAPTWWLDWPLNPSKGYYPHSVIMHSVSIMLTLCTNFLVTSLIGYRAWIHHRTTSVYNIRVGRDRTWVVLLILVESGALYCCIWIAYLPVAWNYDGNSSLAFNILDSAVAQIIVIYPMLIIVLCNLQRSYHDIVKAPDIRRPQVSPLHPARHTNDHSGDVFVVSRETYTSHPVPDMRAATILDVAPSMPIRLPSFIDISASSVDLASDLIPCKLEPSPLCLRSSLLVGDVGVIEAHHLTADDI